MLSHPRAPPGSRQQSCRFPVILTPALSGVGNSVPAPPWGAPAELPTPQPSNASPLWRRELCSRPPRACASRAGDSRFCYRRAFPAPAAVGAAAAGSFLPLCADDLADPDLPGPLGHGDNGLVERGLLTRRE